MSDIHTIFGAGQVGVDLARELAARGHRVRLARRSAAGAPIDGVTWLRGDVTDPAFADGACRGARVVYNCTNPGHYHRWAQILPPLATAVRRAATRAGARLVVLDNLYMVGRPERVPFDERVPMRPCSDKGRLRARLVEELFEAHHRGEVEVVSARASDFFGPHTPRAVVFSPRFFARLAAGRAVEVMGDPDMPHSYSYVPDVVRGLAALGEHPAAPGRVWHLPMAAQLTTRQLVERIAELAGRPVRLRRVPTWALKATGALVPLVASVAEMAYQWEVPYLADDGDLRRLVGVDPTPLDEALGATLEAHGLHREAAA